MFLHDGVCSVLIACRFDNACMVVLAAARPMYGHATESNLLGRC